jgi:asparagine synthetase B (glutamine-hydrolysing)
MPPETLYKGIQRVPFGGCLHMKVSSNNCRIRHVGRYTPEADLSVANLTGETEAVEERLQESLGALGASTDSILFLLSGGLDSSILYRLMERSSSIDAGNGTRCFRDSPLARFFIWCICSQAGEGAI